MQKDSVFKTLFVAGLLCALCSILVSGAAVLLKDKQDANKELDIKKNLLLASGLAAGSPTKEEVEEAFAKIETVVVDLDTGTEVSDIDPTAYDQEKARKTPSQNKEIAADQDKAGIKTRAQKALAYKYKEEGVLKLLILPVKGKGLWSTLYGFIALDSDLETVKGIGFYQHGETPGLGGEIDNPTWKAQWAGKKIYDENLEVGLHVIKGRVEPNDPEASYKVDGLSGATITSNGVTGLVKYWFGQDGFGPYLERLKVGDGESETAELEGYETLEEGPMDEEGAADE